MKGLIFDIQRGSLNDGPGIRTTIFFKGCPLKCPWCHNPESKSSHIQLKVNRKGFRESQEKIKKEFNIDLNDQHEISGEENLSEEFLSKYEVYGKYYDVDEIIRIVNKDMHFYEESGGGLTISGGEPLQQFPFLYELCKSAKAENINICLDTSGYSQRSHLQKIQPFINWFLYDIKTFDPGMHRTFCGGDLGIVFDNLDYLSNSGSNIILRSPIIPGFNDTNQHIKQLKSLQEKYDAIETVELLPYHNLHSSKYDFLPENQDIFKARQEISQEMMDAWKMIIGQIN